MIRRIGKRAEDTLMKNVLSLVIFVISFALIVYGVYKVYNIFVGQETKNAQATLDKTVVKINALEKGQKTSLAVQGFKNSENWRMVFWNSNDPMDSKPDKCALKSCICMCKSADSSVLGKTIKASTTSEIDSCRKSNMCSTLEYPSILVDATAPKTFAGKYAYFLPSNLGELTFEKSASGDSVSINYQST